MAFLNEENKLEIVIPCASDHLGKFNYILLYSLFYPDLLKLLYI